MFKNKKNLTMISLATGVSIALAITGFVNNFNINNRKQELLNTNAGVTSVSDSLLSMSSKKKDGIAVLNVGNSKIKNTNFQNKKLDYLEENAVDIAVIIDCNTDNISTIYDDVDYVKSVLKNNSIDLPVYMNINHIMDNFDLNNNRKQELISTFLEKCNSNGIYVGICGTDTNLCRLKQYVFKEASEYDALVEMENESIKYDGPYNMFKTIDGYYTLKEDISKVIKDNQLNEKSRFENDGTYIYNNEKELEEYLYTCGLSKTELKKYNNKLFLQKGDKLVVPSIISVDNQDESILYYKKLEKPLIGCDLSEWQENGDWDKVSKNMNFIILRSSVGVTKDDKFNEFYKKCIDYNLPVGIYTMINYTKVGCQNFEEFKENQSRTSVKTLELLKNKKITLPVYLDIENPYSAGSDYANYTPSMLFPKEYVRFMLDDWYKKMSSAGYIPGIYANKNYIDYISSCVDYDLSDKFQIWIAGGNEYKLKQNYTEYKMPESLQGYKGATNHQITDSATGVGIANHQGMLDINYLNVDYTKPVYSDDKIEQDSQEEKKFYRVNPDLSALIALSSTGLLGAGITYKKTKRKHK